MNSLRSVSYTHLYLEPYGFDCTNWRHGDIWALISNDAGFDIPQEPVRDRHFEYYPGLFIKDGTVDELLVVLPQQANGSYLTMAANIMAFIGHNLDEVNNIKVIRSSEFERADKQQNLIIIGTPQDNNAIRLINDHLHLRFNKAGDKFEISGAIVIVPEYSNNLASIQLLACLLYTSFTAG